MAKCEVKFPDDFYKKLTEIPAKTEKIVEKILQEGAEIVLKAVKTNLKGALGKGKYSRQTGELQNSLGVSPVDVDNKGVTNIKIGFSEPRRNQAKGGKYGQYQKTNAMVANILEYGASGPGKRKQPPRPFLRPAEKQSKPVAETAMKKTFEKELKKYL